MASTKRKLPVLQAAPSAADEPRPPWQWVGFGTVMIFSAWLPLAYAGAALVAPPVAGGEGRAASVGATVLATALPLAVAAMAGGFLVARFGERARVREPLLAGLVTGLLAVALTAVSGAFSTLFFAVVPIAAGFAGAGGALGIRLRARASAPGAPLPH